MNDINPIKLSACVVVHNEERLIRRCLESIVGVVNEIIVVHDGPCTDATLDIAAEFGAQIIIAPRAGVAEPIRPLSFEAARGEWILQIDGDEFLSPEMKAALPELISRTDVDAYEYVWPLYNGVKPVTKNWPYKRGLFRRSAISFLGLPNFVVSVPGKVVRVPYLVEHRPEYDNYSWTTFKKKWRNWSAIQSELYLRDLSEVPKFNYQAGEWPPNFKIRRRWPLLVLPLDAALVFVKTLVSGAWYRGYYAWKAALLLALSRVIIDWGIFKGKRGRISKPEVLCPCGNFEYRRSWYDPLEKTVFILQCTRCGLARTFPIPLSGAGLEDYYEGRHDHIERSENEAIWQSFFIRTLNIIKKYKTSGSLMDVGCNLGFFVKEAREQGFKAEGVDMSTEAIAFGKEKYNFPDDVLQHGTLETIARSDNSYDIITYLHCFEHLEYPNEEMKEAHRVLKNDGILLIEVPRYYSAWRVVLGRRWYGFSPFQHIWQCGKRGVCNVLESNSFEIVKAYTRISMHHEVNFSLKGLFKICIHALAWLSGTGDNLIIVAHKK